MDLAELQEKMHKKKGVIIRYDDDSNPYVSMPVSSVPLKQFDEFEKVCKQEYNGNRWLMIWTLFLRWKQYELETEISELREQHAQTQVHDDVQPNELGLLNPESEN